MGQNCPKTDCGTELQARPCSVHFGWIHPTPTGMLRGGGGSATATILHMRNRGTESLRTLPGAHS